MQPYILIKQIVCLINGKHVLSVAVSVPGHVMKIVQSDCYSYTISSFTQIATSQKEQFV